MQQQHNNHRLTAIIQVNLRKPAPPVKNWRILFVQSFAARMHLLTRTKQLKNTTTTHV